MHTLKSSELLPSALGAPWDGSFTGYLVFVRREIARTVNPYDQCGQRRDQRESLEEPDYEVREVGKDLC